MTDKFRGIDDEPGWMNRALADIRAEMREQASARGFNPVSSAVQADVTGLTLPATAPASSYGVTAVAVPLGYNRALVQLVAGASVTVAPSATSANGRLRVRPVAGGVLGPELDTEEPGTGILSILSPFSTKLTVVGGGLFNVWAESYCSGTGTTAGSGRVVLSATVLFTRE